MHAAAQWSDDDDAAGGFVVELDPSKDKLVLAGSNVSSWPSHKDNDHSPLARTSPAYRFIQELLDDYRCLHVHEYDHLFADLKRNTAAIISAIHPQSPQDRS